MKSLEEPGQNESLYAFIIWKFAYLLIQSCVLVNSKDRGENYKCDKTVLITSQSCSQLLGAHGATVTMSFTKILQSMLYCGQILFTSPILRANRNLAHVYSHLSLPYPLYFDVRHP